MKIILKPVKKESKDDGYNHRIIHGGSWGSETENSRTSFRYGLTNIISYDRLGFRLARKK